MYPVNSSNQLNQSKIENKQQDSIKKEVHSLLNENSQKILTEYDKKYQISGDKALIQDCEKKLNDSQNQDNKEKLVLVEGSSGNLKTMVEDIYGSSEGRTIEEAFASNFNDTEFVILWTKDGQIFLKQDLDTKKWFIDKDGKRELFDMSDLPKEGHYVPLKTVVDGPYTSATDSGEQYIGNKEGYWEHNQMENNQHPPFYQECQKEGLCGKHATNAFLGKHSVTAREFDQQLVEKSGKEPGILTMNTGTNVENIQELINRREMNVVPIHATKIDSDPFYKQVLEKADRVIVGADNHWVAYRKDAQTGKWWYIDSTNTNEPNGKKLRQQIADPQYLSKKDDTNKDVLIGVDEADMAKWALLRFNEFLPLKDDPYVTEDMKFVSIDDEEEVSKVEEAIINPPVNDSDSERELPVRVVDASRSDSDSEDEIKEPSARIVDASRSDSDSEDEIKEPSARVVDASRSDSDSDVGQVSHFVSSAESRTLKDVKSNEGLEKLLRVKHDCLKFIHVKSDSDKKKVEIVTKALDELIEIYKNPESKDSEQVEDLIGTIQKNLNSIANPQHTTAIKA